MVALAALTLIAFAATAWGQIGTIALLGNQPAQLQQGKTYTFKWMSDGIDYVSFSIEGTLTSIPGSPRGDFDQKIADSIPVSQGSFTWTVPFVDTVRFTLHIRGYNADGVLLAEDTRNYTFRPDFLANRKADGVYVDLRNEQRQRLYLVSRNTVIRAYLTSGARTHVGMLKPFDSSSIHDPVGVFRVMEKIPMYWSREYQVWMTNAMRFWKGHFIHGTYPEEYQFLGTPASSGCIRLDRTNAKELFSMVPVGTRVEVFEDTGS